MAEMPNRIAHRIDRCDDLKNGDDEISYPSSRVMVVVSPQSTELVENNLPLQKAGFKQKVGELIQGRDIDGQMTPGGCRAKLTMNKCHLPTVKSRLNRHPFLQIDLIRSVEDK